MSPIHALLLSGSLRVYSRSPSPAVLRPSCSPEPDQCPVFVPVRRCTPLFLPRPHFHLNFTSLFFLANMPCSFGHPWPPLPSPTDLAGLGRLYQQMALPWIIGRQHHGHCHPPLSVFPFLPCTPPQPPAGLSLPCTSSTLAPALPPPFSLSPPPSRAVFSLCVQLTATLLPFVWKTFLGELILTFFFLPKTV